MSFIYEILITVLDCCEGCWGVKFILPLEWWLKEDEGYSNSGSNAPKRGRSVSIKYETLKTSDELAGEDFQNIGTFMVVRSSVFLKCSGHKRHLARDAYYAC